MHEDERLSEVKLPQHYLHSLKPRQRTSEATSLSIFLCYHISLSLQNSDVKFMH